MLQKLQDICMKRCFTNGWQLLDNKGDYWFIRIQVIVETPQQNKQFAQ